MIEETSNRLGVIGHGWTYSAHPICVAAGIANLEMIDKHGLIESARKAGAAFSRMLREAFSGHRMVGEVRGEGLFAAVEFVTDPEKRIFFDPAQKIGPRVAAALLERSVIARAMPQGDILGFAPPRCLTEIETGRIVDAVAKSL